MDSRSPHHAVHDEKEALEYQVHTALAFPGSDHVPANDLPWDTHPSLLGCWYQDTKQYDVLLWYVVPDNDHFLHGSYHCKAERGGQGSVPAAGAI